MLCCRDLPRTRPPHRYLHYTLHLTHDPEFGRLTLPAQLLYLKLPIAANPEDGRRFYTDPAWLHWLLFAANRHVDTRTVSRSLAELRAAGLIGRRRDADGQPEGRIEGWLWDHVAEVGE